MTTVTILFWLIGIVVSLVIGFDVFSFFSITLPARSRAAYAKRETARRQAMGYDS